MQFVPSKRGKPHLCFEGYQYRHNRDLKNGTSSWRCVKCSVTGHLVKEEEEQEFLLKTEHDHLSSPSKSETNNSKQKFRKKLSRQTSSRQISRKRQAAQISIPKRNSLKNVAKYPNLLQ